MSNDEPEYFKTLEDGNRTYEMYFEDDAEKAKTWLLTKTVTKPLYYVTVKTERGTWGMDKEGLYLTDLLDFQSDLSLATAKGSIVGIPSMFNIGMAARGAADNFVVEVECGVKGCGHQWYDGLRYQDTTVVRCPKCDTYCTIDSRSINYVGA